MTKKEPELSTCPLCDGKVKLVSCLGAYAVECSKCKLTVQSQSASRVVEKWNRRPVAFADQEIPFGTPGEKFGPNIKQEFSVFKGSMKTVCFHCKKKMNHGIRLEIDI
jgi:hypothetical protein